jgi:antirestriction protein ArdC
LVAGIAGRIGHTSGGNRACYSPVTHSINLPDKGAFHTLAGYYSTLAHEIGHAMAKEMGETLDATFGAEKYCKEELVAEMFANFFCSYCGIENEVNNSVAYFQSWLGKLQGNPQWLISAANKAQKRFEKLMEFAGIHKPAQVADTEEDTED